MNWIGWQIDYLLFWQNLRETTNHIFDSFFLFITNFGVGETILILLFGIYWCYNKKIGTYMLHCFILSYMMNIFLKMSFCVYRPWILDNRIHPLKEALSWAQGYSFPSGHTSGVTSVWGSLAVSFWKNKWIRYISLFVIFAVMLSRNYLGVHTPQDVIVSFFVTVFILFAVKRLFQKIETNKEHYNFFIVTIALACLTLGLYVYLKSYPMDYLNGALLYNPYPEQLRSISKICCLFGAMLGCYLEYHLIKFNPEKGGIPEKILRLLVGIIIYHSIEKYGTLFLSGFIDFYMAKCIAFFISGIFVTFFYPAIIKYIDILTLKLTKKA